MSRGFGLNLDRAGLAPDIVEPGGRRQFCTKRRL